MTFSRDQWRTALAVWAVLVGFLLFFCVLTQATKRYAHLDKHGYPLDRKTNRRLGAKFETMVWGIVFGGVSGGLLVLTLLVGLFLPSSSTTTSTPQ